MSRRHTAPRKPPPPPPVIEGQLDLLVMLAEDQDQAQPETAADDPKESSR